MPALARVSRGGRRQQGTEGYKMSDPNRIRLARILFDSFATGDLSAWQGALAPDFTFSYPGLPNGNGAAEARAYNQPFLDAFTAWSTEVHASAVSGDIVFLLLTIRATLSGPLVTPGGTVPATGQRYTVPLVLVSEIRDGSITREATYWNVPDLLAQIVPAAA